VFYAYQIKKANLISLKLYNNIKILKLKMKIEKLNYSYKISQTQNDKKANILSIKSEKKNNSKNDFQNLQKSESGLWKAVIMQAVLDIMSSSKRSSEILAKNSARDWFNKKNSNFITVCSYANLDYEWVLKRVNFALENPRTWRRECDLKNFFKEKKLPSEYFK
jgi:hypothetical protein